MQGTKVQGTIFGQDMNVLKDTLKMYKTYSISNAVVQPTPPEHRVIDNDYQWLLYARTPIEEIVVETLCIRALKYDFVPLAQISNHANSGTGIGICSDLFQILKVYALFLIFILINLFLHHLFHNFDVDVLFAIIRVAPARKTKQTWVQDITIIDQG